ncbi:MAG: transcription elongation factor GreA [Rhodospirillaceae bacterium]|nr:transcription elongation factor GreA [Rhodospirillaceae bacterium]
MEKIPMTPDGFVRLEEELKFLKGTARPEVVKAIGEAREHGDLSENAEYHAAREKQSFIEGRIKELEDLVSRAQIIDISQMSGDQVRFGARVLLADEDTDEEKEYQIVGAHEADLKIGRISIVSPLGKALIGKKAGDSVDVTTPGGRKSFEVIEVKYA